MFLDILNIIFWIIKIYLWFIYDSSIIYLFILNILCIFSNI